METAEAETRIFLAEVLGVCRDVWAGVGSHTEDISCVNPHRYPTTSLLNPPQQKA